VDRDHLVSTLDFTPTLLDATGVAMIPDMDGRSFLPALKGVKMPGWDRVFTFYNQSSARNWLLMRCIRTKDRSYIWNAWCDGKMQYRAENMNGLTWKAMLAAAPTNAAIKQRTDFYQYRVPEEFYDMSSDRYERHNLIKDPSRQAEIESMRKELLALLKRTGDPLAEAFAQRDKPEILAAAKQQLAEEYADVSKKKGKGKAKAKATAAKGKTSAVAPKTGEKLIALTLPDTIKAGKPVTVTIQHHFPDALGDQALTVTIKDGPSNARIERKVVKAKGEGVITVPFDVPINTAGKSVRFAVFVGEDFNQTPQQIQSQPQQVEK
jgi:hypothetical protein